MVTHYVDSLLYQKYIFSYNIRCTCKSEYTATLSVMHTFILHVPTNTHTRKNCEKISGTFCMFPEVFPFLSQNRRIIRPFWEKKWENFGNHTKFSHDFSQCKDALHPHMQNRSSPCLVPCRGTLIYPCVHISVHQCTFVHALVQYCNIDFDVHIRWNQKVWICQKFSQTPICEQRIHWYEKIQDGC